jgi:hypothetical protein
MVTDEIRLSTAASGNRSSWPAAGAEFARFCAGATIELAAHSRDAAAILAAAEAGPARWHPNSFLVFDLPFTSSWGQLRMHIWPAGARVVRGWGPTVHRHGWHLASRVLAGNYSDLLYEDSASAPAGSGWRLTHAFTVDVDPIEPDMIKPAGSIFYLRERERRQVEAESFHYIPAGVFHDTVVPLDTFAATLVMRSRSTAISSLALDDQQAPVRTYRRPEATPAQRRGALAELRASTGS